MLCFILRSRKLYELCNESSADKKREVDVISLESKNKQLEGAIANLYMKLSLLSEENNQLVCIPKFVIKYREIN